MIVKRYKKEVHIDMSVMRNKELSVEARRVYMYLSGLKNEAVIELTDITRDLKINDEDCLKQTLELVDVGLINTADTEDGQVLFIGDNTISALDMRKKYGIMSDIKG